ncbi:hypothetical protein CfE428DRAFT_0740 [Chthoniobacter flavus Ellin428]|uniref:Uncharacterized protein n=1 Tax=Chthoniobacter flavus Ellin428 TaxID=497964 RepID=B4CVQ3_9BACT|nr:hypothetical protein CfE428DRAFT_0740 [Chthoniobacter flavus Ellin428]TCO95446.1 hypothetical protein EV701_101133 [Chthoniobacter flavus]
MPGIFTCKHGLYRSSQGIHLHSRAKLRANKRRVAVELFSLYKVFTIFCFHKHNFLTQIGLSKHNVMQKSLRVRFPDSPTDMNRILTLLIPLVARVLTSHAVWSG